jgi:hypothetical protein
MGFLRRAANLTRDRMQLPSTFFACCAGRMDCVIVVAAGFSSSCYELRETKPGKQIDYVLLASRGGMSVHEP